MRPETGCQSCRARHLKCVLPAPLATTCTRCAETGRACEFRPRYQFRGVDHVDTASQGLRSRTELRYHSDQPWVATAGPVSFVLEDGMGGESGVAADRDDGNERGRQVDGGGEEAGPVDAMVDDEATLNAGENWTEQELMSLVASDGSDEPVAPPALDALLHPSYQYTSPPTASFMTPASVPELTRRYVFGVTGSVATPYTPLDRETGSIAASPATLPAPGSVPAPLKLSRREAFLTQHYIHKIAPWIDCCDLLNHFGLEVPRRAVHKPMVLFSVLALSSMHQALSLAQSRHEASFYHGECLRLLIDALSDDEATYDDNLLASVVLMRVYEEIWRSKDDQHHLRGLGKLLDAIPAFAQSGGLAEAACWQSLRQDIFVSLLKAQPPTFDLANYGQSSAFKFRDEGACANVIVLLFAKVLRLTYSPAEASLPDTWTSLEADIERWNDRRHRLFRPMFDEESDVPNGKPFPVCCMINPPQVVALQYYYSCMVFLLLHKPVHNSLTSFQKARHRRSAERSIVIYLAAIVGLAISNEMVENANFTAEHMLRACGYCINDPIQRRGALDFLARMQRRMGWSTEETSDLLRSQWRDLDDPDE